MSLPAKALQVLADLKRDLLSREAPVIETPKAAEKPKKEEKSRQTMRHAKIVAPAWQAYCRRGRRW